MPYAGAKFPFQIENGMVALTDTRISPELYVYSLIQAWFVEKGEAVFNFNHGVGLQRFTFKPLTDEYKQELKKALEAVTPIFEDRIILTNIEVMSAEEAVENMQLDEVLKELPENTVFIGVTFTDRENKGKRFFSLFNSVGTVLEVGVI